MQRLEVSGEVRPIYGSLGVKRLNKLKLNSYLIIKNWKCNTLPAIKVTAVPFPAYSAWNHLSLGFRTKAIVLEVIKNERTEERKSQPHVLAGRAHSASRKLRCGIFTAESRLQRPFSFKSSCFHFC